MSLPSIIFPEGTSLNCHYPHSLPQSFWKRLCYKTGWSVHILDSSISPNIFLCKFKSQWHIHVPTLSSLTGDRKIFFFLFRRTVQLKPSTQAGQQREERNKQPHKPAKRFLPDVCKALTLKHSWIRNSLLCWQQAGKFIWLLSTGIPSKCSIKGFTDLEDRKPRLWPQTSGAVWPSVLHLVPLTKHWYLHVS